MFDTSFIRFDNFYLFSSLVKKIIIKFCSSLTNFDRLEGQQLTHKNCLL